MFLLHRYILESTISNQVTPSQKLYSCVCNFVQRIRILNRRYKNSIQPAVYTSIELSICNSSLILPPTLSMLGELRVRAIFTFLPIHRDGAPARQARGSAASWLWGRTEDAPLAAAHQIQSHNLHRHNHDRQSHALRRL